MTTILDHAFAHHLWANEQVLEACRPLSPEQLDAPVPGTYGPVIATLRHLIQADSFYLWVYRGSEGPLIDVDNELAIEELLAANEDHRAGYDALLAGPLDSEVDAPEHGPGWDFIAPFGVRIAQILHHGSDHRSQVCTALTAHGLVPPEIDLWAYGRAVGVTREVVTATD